MKRIFLATLCAASLLTFSCTNSKDANDKDKNKDDDKEVVDKPGKEDDDETEKNYTKAAKGMCGCISEKMDELSSTTKRIITKAADSDNPQATLKNELMNIDDEAEKQKVASEFQKFGTAVQETEFTNCAKKVQKKYNIDESSKSDEKKLMQAVEENGDCDILSALYKIGTKTQGNNE